MEITKYISDLLYRYDCVIIPDFGGFITNKIGAKLDEKKQLFYPPTKQITFNYHLKKNDGLLANYIATCENISYESSLHKIKSIVLEWEKGLQNNSIEFKNIGTLSYNESKNLIFNPYNKENYLTDSFGLSTFQILPKEEVKKVIPITSAEKKEEKTNISSLIKYAATAAILLTLGFTGNNIYQNNKQKEVIASQEKAIEKKIQAATFVISEPLPTIKLNVEKEAKKPYHVIAGAFQFPENATKKVNQLKSEGFKASILGKNKWGLTEVAFESFSNKNDAINKLYKIQKNHSKDAWLLVK